MEKRILYEDPSFEALTKQEINDALSAMQHIVDTWHGLRLPAITTKSEMYDILHNTDAMIREAQAAFTKVTNDTNIPVPSSLPIDFGAVYSAVQAARQFAYTDRQYSMFSIKGKKVIINEDTADLYVHARTLVAETESQEQFYEDVQAFARAFNRINQLTGGSLTRVGEYRAAWGQVLQLPPEGFDNYEAFARVDKLREFLQMI